VSTAPAPCAPPWALRNRMEVEKDGSCRIPPNQTGQAVGHMLTGKRIPRTTARPFDKWPRRRKGLETVSCRGRCGLVDSQPNLSSSALDAALPLGVIPSSRSCLQGWAIGEKYSDRAKQGVIARHWNESWAASGRIAKPSTSVPGIGVNPSAFLQNGRCHGFLGDLAAPLRPSFRSYVPRRLVP
jgi:hypothetical protein